MSENERTGSRDLSYSRWHRSNSLKRFVGARAAFECAVIDIDWCEYCRLCKNPIALIETQRSRANPKPAPVTAMTARLAQIRAYSVSYWLTDAADDIAGFKVQMVCPEHGPVVEMIPQQYAEFLVNLHGFHECAQRRRGAA